MARRPRDYQVEAARWALERGRAVVCMPTGTGKTLVAALWIRWLLEAGRARRVLVLEPTRFLVEQVARFLREEGLDAAPVHGSLPRGVRVENARRARVVVATPEIVAAEMELFSGLGFDAVVVDECHHTTGQDAYRVVLESLPFRWRLGLTAYVPPSRRATIEADIGEIRCWSWSDPRLARYIPEWAAEIYEAPFNEAEERLYRLIERRWEEAGGERGARTLLGNALRWLARDGALALRETVERSERLRRLLEGEPLELLYSPRVRPLHKLEALERALRDHEGFRKAIVFVERVAVAERVAERFAELEPVLVLGRRRVDPREALERARRRETRLIVATSAGEEGIDLPEADLLVVWSNVASPLRFIQRLGRMLRAAPEARGSGPRTAVFLVTPETVDVDSLVDALLEARRAGVHVPVEPGTVEYLWSLSRRRRFLEALEERPMPLDLLARAVGAPREKTEEAVRWLLERGLAVYIYHPALGRVYAASSAVEKLRRLHPEAFQPDLGVRLTWTLYVDGRRVRSVRDVDRARAEARLRAEMERLGGFSRLHASGTVEAGRGLLRLARLSYSFRVDTLDKLRLVLDNAYTRDVLLSPVR